MVGRLFTAGRIERVPAKRKVRAAELLEGGRYRTAGRAPERAGVERQEVPAWEAYWLPGFLAGSG